MTVSLCQSVTFCHYPPVGTILEAISYPLPLSCLSPLSIVSAPSGVPDERQAEGKMLLRKLRLVSCHAFGLEVEKVPV